MVAIVSVIVLVGGGILTTFYLVNAVLSFAGDYRPISSWIRLQVAAVSLMGTLVLWQLAAFVERGVPE